MKERIRVLHVDDEPGFAETTATFLESEDDVFSVEAAMDAGAALDLLSDEEYDCVVSDHEMPGKDGIEFFEAVREEHPKLPFILFTGKGSEGVASDAISAGVTEYLQKRPDAEQYELLANRVEKAVAKRRAETNHRELFEKTQIGLTIHDPDTGVITDTNRAFADLLGYEPEELVGMHPSDFTPGDSSFSREEADRLVRQAAEEGPQTFEWRDETKDGDDIWVEVSLRRTRINGTERVLAVAKDITERKEREKELERYEAFVENSSDVIVHLDEDATLLYESPGTERLLEREPGSFVGEDVFEYIHPDDREEILEKFSEVLNNPEKKRETQELRIEKDDEADEGYVWAEAAAADQTDTELGAVVVSLRDITERKERERELERKNERLDEFARVVSHDLRNPLTVAKGRLELAQREYESEHLEKVEETLDRMNTLIEDILELAREGTEVSEMEEVDFEEVAEECWQNVETKDANLLVDTDLTVRADRTRLRQLVENLIRNSVEHGSTGNRTGSGDAVEHDASTEQENADDDITVTVGDLDDEDGFYVADDGRGIPESEREKVFESGYSASEEERGTGFGLSIAREVAEAHGWGVGLTESEDGGARFEFTGAEAVRGSED